LKNCIKLKKKRLLHARIRQLQGLRPLDPHQAFALDPPGASRHPSDPLPSTAPPVQKFLDPPLLALKYEYELYCQKKITFFKN
jgi:hypothetical protein